jgi:hypothetical protein
LTEENKDEIDTIQLNEKSNEQSEIEKKENFYI